MRYGSAFRFLTFWPKSWMKSREELLRSYSVKEPCSWLKKGKLLYLHLPSDGVDVEAFLGQDKGQRYDSYWWLEMKETKEFRNMFEKLGFEVENLNQYPELPEVEETGLTFEENARLKSWNDCRANWENSLSGWFRFEGGYLGEAYQEFGQLALRELVTDAENNAKLLHRIGHGLWLERSFSSVPYDLGGCKTRQGKLSGGSWLARSILILSQGEHGFGYDPLFLVGETGRCCWINVRRKNTQSHRALAVKKLLRYFHHGKANNHRYEWLLVWRPLHCWSY